MRTDYTRPIHVQVKKPASKLRVNKKRLFIVFACAFVLFFLVCTLLASILTPNIDVPALNNEQEVAPSITSDDFKGKMDPRLKSIEQQEEGTAPAPIDSQNNSAEPAKNGVKTHPQSNVNNNIDMNNNVDNSNYQEADPVPYNNNRNTDILMPEDLKYQDSEYTQESPKPSRSPMPARKSQPRPSTQPQDLDLREKVDEPLAPTPSTSMNKVILGKFASTSRAREAADELINKNPNIDPYIVSSNGAYSIQVGSFSTYQKAQKLTSEMNKGNFPVKIIKD